MKFLDGSIRQAVGTLVIVILAFIFPAFRQIVLLSIVCTVGISLFIWLPIAYLIGSIILGIISLFTKSKGSIGEKMFLKERIALEDYICGEKAKGVSEQDIISALKGEGWTENKIKDVLGDLSESIFTGRRSGLS